MENRGSKGKKNGVKEKEKFRSRVRGNKILFLFAIYAENIDKENKYYLREGRRKWKGRKANEENQQLIKEKGVGAKNITK